MDNAKEYIVIAEDSAPNRMILTHLLKKLGFEVLDFDDGAKAWAALEKETEKNIIAVFSDIMMPNMDGMDFLRKVRSSDRFKNMPFVLVTALTGEDWVKEAQSLNCSGSMAKPASKDKVVEALKTLFPDRKFI